MTASRAPNLSLPQDLHPTTTESVLLADGRVVRVPKVCPRFTLWSGPPVLNSFGRKQLLDHAGQPLFAELLILRRLREAGWSGRWISTYGASPSRPRFLSSWCAGGVAGQKDDPIKEPHIRGLLSEIADGNGGVYSGCWDVLAWKGENLVFAESKRAGRDRMRPTQRNWLASAIASGVSSSHFLVVEWTLSEERR